MKAFVISLSKVSASLKSGNETLESLKSMGFDASLFEGTYGDDAVKLFREEGREIHPFTVIVKHITDEERKIYKKVKPYLRYQYYKDRRMPVDKEMYDKMSRPGVLGCFYSHYRLWKKCIELKEPIYIFEDDVIFVRNFTPVDFNHVLIVALGKTYYKTKYKEEFENPTRQPRRRKWPHPSMPGAVGYGITPNAAKKLVSAYRHYVLPADNAINQFVTPIEIHSHLIGRAAIAGDGKISLTKHWDLKE